jgi:hypothetical protein
MTVRLRTDPSCPRAVDRVPIFGAVGVHFNSPLSSLKPHRRGGGVAWRRSISTSRTRRPSSRALYEELTRCRESKPAHCGRAGVVSGKSRRVDSAESIVRGIEWPAASFGRSLRSSSSASTGVRPHDGCERGTARRGRSRSEWMRAFSSSIATSCRGRARHRRVSSSLAESRVRDRHTRIDERSLASRDGRLADALSTCWSATSTGSGPEEAAQFGERPRADTPQGRRERVRITPELQSIRTNLGRSKKVNAPRAPVI